MAKQKGFLFITKKGHYTCDNCGVTNIHPECVKHLNRKDYCIGCYTMLKEMETGKKVEEVYELNKVQGR